MTESPAHRPFSASAECTRSVTVLLTATVNPNSTPGVAIGDRQRRLVEYKRALRRWLAVPAPFSLVLCENSGYDLSEFAHLCGAENASGRSITLVSLPDNGTARKYGKGRGELTLIERCFEHESCRDLDGRILKVTGRLWVRNAAALLAGIKGLAADVACDLQRNLTIADSRVFCATRVFLDRYLLPRRAEPDDRQGIYFEHVLARAVHSALADGRSWAPLPCTPAIEGTSATSGRPYPAKPAWHTARILLHWVKRTVIAR